MKFMVIVTFFVASAASARGKVGNLGIADSLLRFPGYKPYKTLTGTIQDIFSNGYATIALDSGATVVIKTSDIFLNTPTFGGEYLPLVSKEHHESSSATQATSDSDTSQLQLSSFFLGVNLPSPGVPESGIPPYRSVSHWPWTNQNGVGTLAYISAWFKDKWNGKPLRLVVGRVITISEDGLVEVGTQEHGTLIVPEEQLALVTEEQLEAHILNLTAKRIFDAQGYVEIDTQEYGSVSVPRKLKQLLGEEDDNIVQQIMSAAILNILDAGELGVMLPERDIVIMSEELLKQQGTINNAEQQPQTQ